jgi:phosphatidate cytidylyltransferase
MSRNLELRIATALPGIAVTLAVLWYGGWILGTFAAVLGVLGTREVYDLARRQGIEPLDAPGLAAAAAMPFCPLLARRVSDWESVAYGAGLWLIGVLTAAIWLRSPERRPLESLSVTVFGALYASALPAFIMAIRHSRQANAQPGGSFALVVLPLVVTWVGDTFAHAVGTLIGGPKLAPVLSPKKTWSGAAGGVAGALLASVLYGSFVLPRFSVGLRIWQLVLTGLMLSVIGQLGDATESLLKREARIKDSSSLLPGHGGILDRLDSLYFVLPVSAGLFRLFGVA